MALRVWLPLTGTLENKGISNVTPTIASGNSWASTGKIGAGAITLTKQQTILPTSSCMTGVKQMSYCYWVKVNTAWSAQWLDGITWYSTDGSSAYVSRQEFYTNCTLIGTWYKGGSISGKTFTPGVWTHIAGVFDYTAGTFTFYINGTSVGTTTNVDTTHYCRGDFYIGDNGVDICENDVRIYDHCLSAAEVHEISQGLVLHYKLDGFNNASMLPPQYQQLEYIESSGTSYFDTGCKFNIETDACKVIFKGNDTSNNGMILASNSSKYFWFYYYGSNGIRVYGHNGSAQQGVNGGNNNLNDHTMEFKNKTYYLDGANKGSLSNTYTETTHNLWLFDRGNNVNPFKGRIYYAEIIRNGTKQRAFIPAKRLTDSVAGMYDLITNTFYVSNNTAFTAGTTVGTLAIQDSSGYGHNGTIIGTPFLVKDTARYSSSIAFNGTTDAINCGRTFEIQQAQAMTFCSWIYSDNWNNSTNKYYLSSQESGGFVLRSLDNNKLRARIHAYTASDLSTTSYIDADYDQSSANIGASGWHHVAGVYTTSDLKLYIDGILRKTTSTTTYGAHFNSSAYLFLGAECAGRSPSTFCNCKLSDVRIYYTALSDADILSLYNTAAKVDNLHNMHTFEYIEDSSNIKLTKQGQFKEGEIQEDITTKFYKTNNTIKAKNFIEF